MPANFLPTAMPAAPPAKRKHPCPTAQAQATLDTPLGPLLLAASAHGLAGAWFDGQNHHPGPLGLPEDPDHPWLRLAAQALQAYFQAADGDTAALALDLPLNTTGTPFQQAVWQALCNIPAGRLSTYGAIAAALGRPAAVRAVGAAVGRNPVSIAIPCHRVVGHQGQLTGYAGGLWRKQALLRHEGLRLAGAPEAGSAQLVVLPEARFWAGAPTAQVTGQTELFAPPHTSTVAAGGQR